MYDENGIISGMINDNSDRLRNVNWDVYALNEEIDSLKDQVYLLREALLETNTMVQFLNKVVLERELLTSYADDIEKAQIDTRRELLYTVKHELADQDGVEEMTQEAAKANPVWPLERQLTFDPHTHN